MLNLLIWHRLHLFPTQYTELRPLPYTRKNTFPCFGQLQCIIHGLEPKITWFQGERCNTLSYYTVHVTGEFSSMVIITTCCLHLCPPHCESIRFALHVSCVLKSLCQTYHWSHYSWFSLLCSLKLTFNEMLFYKLTCIFSFLKTSVRLFHVSVTRIWYLH